MLDLKASNFTKWPNFLCIVVTQFVLTDHHEMLLCPAGEEWLRMDSTVLCWLYGSITPGIAVVVGTMAASVLHHITTLFRDNQQACVGYLGQKFCNIEQGDTCKFEFEGVILG
jgi:hypothetical protein